MLLSFLAGGRAGGLSPPTPSPRLRFTPLHSEAMMEGPLCSSTVDWAEDRPTMDRLGCKLDLEIMCYI